MAKLLYIIVNSKPEELSTSRTVARKFINKYLELNPRDMVEEIDLYYSFIPEINYKIFTSRAIPASGQDYDNLSEDEKKQVGRVNELCDQFLSADKYVIAAPMWNIFFPAKLKQYLECIIINGKVIKVTNQEVTGLLNNKERKMLYIQSSGGIYPPIISGKVNLGVKYLKDSFKFLGISTFKKIMVEGVDMDDVGKEQAIKEADEDLNHIVKKF